MSDGNVREVLLEDPTRPGMAAVVRAGSLLFLSSVDGVSDHRTGEIDHSVFGDGPAQARRAYSVIVERLEECGLDGTAAVRIEHATASQDWRLQRMALWPEYFGAPTRPVSQGYQGKMVGRNMITVAAVAAYPDMPREIITPGPNPGRASRITRCGEWIFVIGVRGETSLASGKHAAQETPTAFAEQVRFCYDNLTHHLRAGNASITDVVRFDGFIRDVNRLDELFAVAGEHCGPFEAAETYVACPLGGSTDAEISAMAIAPGEQRTSVTGPDGRLTVVANGLAFTPHVSGDADASGTPQPDLCGDLDRQTVNCLDRLAGVLPAAGSDLDATVRLDVYLSDPYRFEHVDRIIRDRFAGTAPAVVRHGVDLGASTLVGMAAIAVTSRSNQ
jgi:enamine deaminase RidA (YjgF/YER057c/UK114 family)